MCTTLYVVVKACYTGQMQWNTSGRKTCSDIVMEEWMNGRMDEGKNR